MKSVVYLLLILFTVVMFSGCAPGHNPMEDTARPGHEIAGFWAGVWHGIIAPFTFIGSWFSDNVEVYEVFNKGGLYWFGFISGFGIWTSGAIVVRKE